MNGDKKRAAGLRQLLPGGQRPREGAPSQAAELAAPGSPDIPMLLITAILTLFGCVMVYSASAVYAEQYHDDSTYFIVRHLVFLLIAVATAALIVKLCTPLFWEDFSIVLFAVSIVMLLLVLVIGVDLGSGAKRWLDLGIFTVQPSEIAKLGLVMVLAKFMSRYGEKVRSPYRFGGGFLYGVIYPGLMIGGVAALVAAERHISGLIIIGCIGLSIMILGGTRGKWIGMIIALGICAVCLLILVSDYAQVRVNTWLHIDEADPLGAAWQTLQGLMAIGSGGLFGVGLGNSRQKFGYVSQPQNDFIFTIICEELGFFGAVLVLSLFALFVWRGFYIARHAPNTFCALAVYGLSFKVGLQVVLNIAVVTNSMPNTGISLPFFSYGGTSLILQMIEVAIILSISRYSSHQKI